jgi:phenazine biosynthesis protein phzE
VDTTDADESAAAVEAVFAGRRTDFALLHRGPQAPAGLVEVLLGNAGPVGHLRDLPLDPPPGVVGPRGMGPAMLAVVPYRQITERGFVCNDDRVPILAMPVHGYATLTVEDALRRIEDVPTLAVDAGFDVGDDEYAAIVRRVLTDDIGRGEGANFVISRALHATVRGWSPRAALSVFRRLLLNETGAYWTFLVHTGHRTFIGASPERHLSLAHGTAVMNPISGTYRYPPEGASLPGLLRFLSDRKETDELYMVLDEELKIMSALCDSRVRVTGPGLREMARLAHTEYLIEGRTSMNVVDLFRATMFAPTVTGSPLENACRVIARRENGGRGYYAGALVLTGRDRVGRPWLDSTILIRTAVVDPAGRVRVGVGATVVRASDPAIEAAETRAKAATLLDAVSSAGVPPAAHRPPAGSLGRHPRVRSVLRRRNAGLSGLWLGTVPGGSSTVPTVPEIVGRTAVIVDAEDRFTAMLAELLRRLGLSVSIRPYHEPFVAGAAGLLVIGPGPGDPREHGHPKIRALRATTGSALAAGDPLLAICLGHQILADLLGLPVVRKEIPQQGVQHEIELFGRRELLGFYNSFAAVADSPAGAARLTPIGRFHRVGPVDVSSDPATGEVHALRGRRFVSLQFHPESVLSHCGTAIVGNLLAPLLHGTKPPAVVR